MKSVNTVTLLGHVTHPPELKKPADGQTVCTMGLATNRSWKGSDGTKQESTEFHNLVAFGGFAEFCGKYIKKGKPLYVEGHLKTSTWENKEKIKLHRTEVIVDNLVLLGAKDKSPVSAAEELAVAA